MSLERQVLLEKRGQIERDLAEVAEQADAGDLDHDTRLRLEQTYRHELAELDRDLADLPTAPTSTTTPSTSPQPRSRRRILMGAALLITSFAGIIFLATRFVLSSDDALQGAAAEATDIDPSTVSNETLEAVVQANGDNPQINGMRMALARRYFDEGNYQKALEHYQAVLANDPDPDTTGEALARMGWMVYDGNGEVDLALSLLSQSLDVAPTNVLSKFLLARVTWCGAGDPATAAGLFEEVLQATDLAPDVRGAIEDDLAMAKEGEACP